MDAAYGTLILLVIIVAGVGALGARMMAYCGDFGTLRFPRALVSSTAFAPGDVILFTASAHGFTNSAVTRDFFSHAGMVVRDPRTRRLYLSDSSGSEVMPAADGTEYATAAAAATIPLYARLKYYPGELYHMRLEPDLTPSQERRLWDLAQERAPYPCLWQSLAGLLRLPRWARGGTSRHCMQHVAWLIDGLALTPTELMRRGALLEHAGFVGTSRAVTRIAGRPLALRGDSGYAPPVKLLYDLDCLEG